MGLQIKLFSLDEFQMLFCVKAARFSINCSFVILGLQLYLEKGEMYVTLSVFPLGLAYFMSST